MSKHLEVLSRNLFLQNASCFFSDIFVGNLEGSIFVNNAILGGVELFANTVAIWIVKLGRRPAIVSSFAIAALSMLAMCFAQSKSSRQYSEIYV